LKNNVLKMRLLKKTTAEEYLIEVNQEVSQKFVIESPLVLFT